MFDYQGNVIGAVIVFRDVIERKKYEEQIRFYAFHDTLTGLPNRRLFQDRLTMALANSQRNDTPLALLFLDLDQFKFINDSLGHDVGDLLLKEAAARLVDSVRENDIVARLGGDEFTIIIEKVSKVQLDQIAKRIVESLSKGYLLKGSEVYSTPSIGISMYPEDGKDAETLIKNADTAMYHAKRNGKNNFFYFNKDINQEVHRKIMIDKGLRKAIENEEFVLNYQPKIEFASGKMIGVEALIRWDHPEMRLVSPDEFIPVAEETGQIRSIGMWVIQTACKHGQEWRKKGFPPLRMAVNVSLQQLIHEDFVMILENILKETHFNPNDLEFEITESVMQSGKQTIHVLQKLKSLGIYISIDDFGTGYSSLNYLKRLPIDALKIDKSFVADIQMNQVDTEIVTTIISLAKSLRLKVIAEGVETEKQSQFLREKGCDEAQGYFFSKPVPAKDFEKIMDEAIKTKYVLE